MIQTGFESRVKVQQIISNQLPEFILDESPKAVDFLKQYYISQEYQGGPTDISENLDQYLKLDYLRPEVVVDTTVLAGNISASSNTILVSSTKGFPQSYGLLKIDDEIITYTGITTNSFTGCIRGFSGITQYHSDLDQEELVFEQTSADSHTSGTIIENLSTLFLKEFYKKIKYTLTPGLEDYDFIENLNVGNFIKESKSFYQSKGTEESFRILFNILFGTTPKIIDLETFLIKPSSAQFIRREVVVAEALSGNPSQLVGQSIQKIDDPTVMASVSEIEIFTRNQYTYYKLFLFVGFDDSSPTITGNFTITQATRVVDSVSIGASVVTVDSTIGFDDSGVFICENNTVAYEEKSVNQFIGCSGIDEEIAPTSIARSNEIYIGYENGDITKPVELRLTGVISKFIAVSDDIVSDVGQKIGVKSVGKIIKNPLLVNEKTQLETFANSWIYNTSSRYQIETVLLSGSAVVLKSNIDKSSLSIGDTVQILQRNSQTDISSSLVIQVLNINQATRQVDLSENIRALPGYLQSFEYDIRRNVKKAVSSGAAIQYGNNNLISDVQNVYIDDNQFAYVASNSLPSQYVIDTNTFELSIADGSLESSFIDPSSEISDNQYSIISFDSPVPNVFVNGSEIFYQPEGPVLPGLSTGTYFVEVLDPRNKIKLYSSRSLITSADFQTFSPLPPSSGKHVFLLSEQRLQDVYGAKLLRKFPIDPEPNVNVESITTPGSTGILINGVEISNYKSEDKIYYGPLESISIINSGRGYDVVNPPLVEVSNSVGNPAKIQPVISGSVEKVFVDPQEFDIDFAVSAKVKGGNGQGASLEPVISTRRREIEFDARPVTDSGNLDIANELIVFPVEHNLKDGEPIVYDPGPNAPIGISTFGDLNPSTTDTLSIGAIYYPEIINSRTIQLYPNFSSYISGINTIGFTTTNNRGFHNFKTEPKKTLSEIRVLNSGSNYTNRKLIVEPSGISTVTSSVIFENHGFIDGDLITYDYETTIISGLSTSTHYFILKIDNNTFRLSDAGIDGTILSNYQRKKYVEFDTTGSGYQYFSYPEITVDVQFTFVGLGTTTTTKSISAIPSVKGSIVDAYLYEKGLDYGSTILNLHKRPQITIKNGKNAQIDPIIVNGRIIRVNILFGGAEYFSTPSIVVNGTGSGAELRPIIVNNRINQIIIVNPGANYDSNTSISVISSGINGSITANVRELSLNNQYKYGNEVVLNNPRRDPKGLEYTVLGYNSTLRNAFGDTNPNAHSPIIGWSYDGHPIYGGNAFSDPTNPSSIIKTLVPGYTLDTDSVVNRPVSDDFVPGFFVEDYRFTNSGDLDKFNGRFAKTPEFPNGTYAYFAGIGVTSGVLEPFFPYFIGNSYKSEFVAENKDLDQSFNFNNSSLVRNTFPYKVGEINAENDFIFESSTILDQKSTVDSITEGSVDSLRIINPGLNYKVGDALDFESISGGGISAKVSSVVGAAISNIVTTVDSYETSFVTWEEQGTLRVFIQPFHRLKNGDNIVLSSISNNNTRINGSYNIGISSAITSIASSIPTTAVVGFVTDIYLTTVPTTQNISIGSSINVNSESLTVLNIFNNENVLRVRRSATGIAHSIGDLVFLTPDSFTIKNNVSYFESEINQKVFFNPLESVGVGTTSGIGVEKVFRVGDISKNISIPTKSIFLPNHPFKTNQEVIFKIPSGSNQIAVANTSSSTPFNIPSNGIEQTLFVIKKSKDFIGLVTQIGLTTTTDGLFFTNFSQTGDSRDFQYLLETSFDTVTAKVEKIDSLVSLTTAHNLSNGDIVNLTVKPNKSVGIGTSTAIRVLYKDTIDSIIIDPIGFSSTGINTTTNIITIPNHIFKTGDNVFYDADIVSSGLQTGSYFIYKVDNNKIKLSETIGDINENPASFVSIGSSGGFSHTLSLVSPQIKVVKNNDLVFDLTDSSLSGYKFRLFYDRNFISEFVSTGTTSIFSTSLVGPAGINTNASFTLRYGDDLPEKLYYTLESIDSTLSLNSDVEFYSEIIFVDSEYNGKYEVSGITSTSFNISLKRLPENISYTDGDCDVISYTTTSPSALGGMASLKIVSGGSNYRDLPLFVGTDSENGDGAFVVSQSSSIGKINQVIIQNEGFEYSSDKTLKPIAFISPNITIDSCNTISTVEVISGGKNYVSVPDLVIVDSDSGQLIDSGLLIASFSNNSITAVIIDSFPKGLPSKPVTIRAINNTNGVSISRVDSSSSGIVTCTLVTPVTGFSIPPFAVNDEIWVEGIQKDSLDGSGFNSSDYGYRLFNVTSFFTTNPAVLEYTLSDLTTNPGTAKTSQESFASIVNGSNYPRFEVTQEFSPFAINEQLLTKLPEQSFEVRDLFVDAFTNTFVKVSGTYVLSEGELIKGFTSGNIARIETVKENEGEFIVDYSAKQTYGWNDQTGILNDDYQVIPDNDYYQNLSYSVKSIVTFSEMITPVNSLVHSAGLKNFADTQIFESGITSIRSQDNTESIIDAIIENRVDTINNYDFGIDIDLFGGRSKFIKLKNRKITDYIECRTNRVLKVDDVRDQFSDKDSNPNTFAILDSIEETETFNNYFIQVKDLTNNRYQIHELVVLNDDRNIFSLSRNFISSDGGERFAEINSFEDEFNVFTLRFIPVDPFNTNFEIKQLSQRFNSSVIGSGSSVIGSVLLNGSNQGLNVGIASTTIYSLPVSSYKSVHSTIQVIDNATSSMNYVEVYTTHDGVNAYQSEYYFNNTPTNISIGSLGTFRSYIDSGVLKLDYIKPSNSRYTVRTKNIGFGSTDAGIGTYRFILSGQVPGLEKSAIYNSKYAITTGAASTVYDSFISQDFTGFKGIVQITADDQISLHQVTILNDGSAGYTVQYPFISIGSTSGIGTFGTEYSGVNINLVFYPDSSVTGIVTVQSLVQALYSDIDSANIAPDLEYGSVSESISVFRYFGINDENFNKIEFPINYQGVPIFKKFFNPDNSAQLDLQSGIISIPNHFFSTGEELTYIPASTFDGVSSSPIGIGATLNSVGVVTNLLPTTVFPIKITNDTFRLSTRKDYSLAGISVTFTNTGSGNAHALEMNKKLEKSLITVDNLVQSPVSFTPINYDLTDNGGVVSAESSFISMVGIASIIPEDLLRINDEYVGVVNVGLGTTAVGPITNTGSFNLVEVRRGFVGSSATSHNDGDNARVYRGSFNIVGNNIYFTEAPTGNALNQINSSNIRDPKSQFSGRVFLRQDYTTNQLYDSISQEFTGTDQLYTLTVAGLNTVGLGTSGGNGVVLINSIFQTPSTENNANNNYEIVEDEVAGISSVRFTGITSVGGSIIISNSDINQNQLPRGGLIVSLGSTSGLGFAPLVGASVTAIVGAGGSIVAVGVGTTDYRGSGYNGLVSIGVSIYEQNHVGTQANVIAQVGAGGTLSFNVVGSGGTGYTNPQVFVGPPSYENLEVIGVSRLGIGATTETGTGLLISLEVGASSTTGIGSTLFEVTSFKVSRSGYGFKRGDVIRPVGLVTALGLPSPVEPFELTIEDTFSDSFSAWQFGELNFIDDIKNLQDGVRTRFPLFYNGSLLSFETNPNDADSAVIDFDSLLVIFVNGVLQDPTSSYEFIGGSSFTFITPPTSNDEISIFFYVGTRELDSIRVDVNSTIKEGDEVQLSKFNSIPSTIAQDPRTIFYLSGSDRIESNLYSGSGIDDQNFKPLSWIKQKVDQRVNGELVSKSRDSIEGTVYPTAKVIADVESSNTPIYLDSIDLFDYEDIGVSERISAILVDDNSEFESGEVTSSVGMGGTVILSLDNVGSGYTGSSITLSIAAPPAVGVGIGTTSTATISVVGGKLAVINIIDPGFGYDGSKPPSILVPPPSPKFDLISDISKSSITGNKGTLTGITTITGVGVPLAITFTLSSASGISTGHSIYVYDTNVGNGITSIISSDSSVVAVGTTFVDNIYFVNFVNVSTGVVTCNVRSNTNVLGINTSGTNIGKFSWGKISGFSKSTQVAIAVTGKLTSSGLSTYPTLQRRGYGLRDIGALKKTL
jgi:hypothetical protein